jgi:predicted cobalt transporter CbtA
MVMKTKFFAGLISSVVLACLWLEWSAVAVVTAACNANSEKKQIVTPVAAKKADAAKIAVLRFASRAHRPDTSQERVEIAVLQLNLSLDKDMPKKK